MNASIHPVLIEESPADLQHNGADTTWRLYSEPRGTAFSYTISGPGWNTQGSASTIAEAFERIATYYRHTAR